MNTTLTIKLPKKLRDDAKRTAKKLGIPLTTATTALLRQFVVDQEIVLSAKRPKADLLQAMKDLRAGKGEVHTGSTKEIFDRILSS